MVRLPLVIVSGSVPFLFVLCQQIVPVIEIGQEVADDMWPVQFEKRALVDVLHSFEILVFLPSLFDGGTANLGGRILAKDVASIEGWVRRA